MIVKSKMVRKNSKAIRESVSSNRKKNEPVLDEKSTLKDITECMKWYSDFCDSSQSKKWLLEYMQNSGYTKENIAKVKSLSWHKSGLEIENGNIINLKFAGFVSRLYNRGYKKIIPENYTIRMNLVIDYCIKTRAISFSSVSANVQNEPSDVDNKSIQEHIKSQVSNLCGELEGELDDFYDNGFKTNLNVYEWLKQKNVKGLIAKKIGEEFKPLFEEISNIEVDDDLREAYSHLKKSQRKKYLDFLNTLIGDCDRYSSNQNKQRKPRKKKPITVDKIVSKLNCKIEDSEYKIKSIDSTQIIGSSVLWVFNVKYRKLGIYTSLQSDGLTVKGSSIQGFDKEKSVQKTIRKPEDVLNLILKGPKVSTRKFFESIKSKEQTLTGRINNETILLRVFK